ncbi:MAG: aldehyde dehydrogenase family protein, partial [Woeseiaceae bacterium]
AEEFAARAAALRVGDPLETGTDQGAVISERHLAKVENAIRRAREDGGRVRAGAERVHLDGRCAGGWFLSPAVIDGLPASAPANQEEIFGPVATLLPFDDEDEAVEIANGTKYGLAASVWSRDGARTHRLAERLNAGLVWVNCWMLRDLRVPMGGMKHSGVGREGGEEAMRFFTEAKNVCVHYGQDASI